MKTEWKVDDKEYEKQSILFEKFDIDKYNNAAKAYEDLPNSEKSNYKGMDSYIKKDYGISLLPSNLKYMRLMKEANLRIKSDKIPEILNIDPILDKRMVRDLLSSLENVEYIKNLYKEKNLM